VVNIAVNARVQAALLLPGKCADIAPARNARIVACADDVEHVSIT
jgi:hypothetical protein